MELAQYLMMASMKRSRHNSSSSSWEEKAFAEDHLGEIVWPPRSYSCSFCHREFRSAQALGGHMNVHRRDRARLKQSSLVAVPNPSLFRVSSPQHHHKEDEENKDGGVLSYSSYSVMINQKERSQLVLDEGIMGLKRVKVASICSTMFPVKKCSSEEGVVVEEEEEEEELDLELRL